MRAGLFDNAEVEIWLVNWQDTAERLLLRKGNLGEVTRGGLGFTAEVRGLAHHLEPAEGPRLPIWLRCGVWAMRAAASISTIAAFPRRGHGRDGRGQSRASRASGLDGFADGWFARGRLIWTSGANAGRAMEVQVHRMSDGARVIIELWQADERRRSRRATASPSPPAATSNSRPAGRNSHNAVNFRGFPHMPGNDFVLRPIRNRATAMTAGAVLMTPRAIIVCAARAWLGTPYATRRA